VITTRYEFPETASWTLVRVRLELVAPGMGLLVELTTIGRTSGRAGGHHIKVGGIAHRLRLRKGWVVITGGAPVTVRGHFELIAVPTKLLAIKVYVPALVRVTPETVRLVFVAPGIGLLMPPKYHWNVMGEEPPTMAERLRCHYKTCGLIGGLP